MLAVPGPILSSINSPADLKKLPEEQLPLLCKEIRAFLIEETSQNPGHLGSSLGAVELAVAIHYVFDTPYDKLIWDVGHQAYAHKILTGRRDLFSTNRTLGGISGFPKMSESEYDAFGTGHSSTSLSAALGMAVASALQGDPERMHISVIGDAALAGGMAMEALNHAGVFKANLLVVLNDNGISIDPNVGAFKDYLARIADGQPVLHTRSNFFEAFNFQYFGPVDGHDVIQLVNRLREIRYIPGPKLLHTLTTKGKGFRKAEEEQTVYHAPGYFNKVTGELIEKETAGGIPPKYQDVFGRTIIELARQNEKIVGITPAMPTGSSLVMMMAEMPDRAFDVGIAEQHAVTFAAGMAARGMIPFCNIYSSFMQRAYDQVIHDVALQKLPVVFCLDRSGLVGEDGATHHGAFDLAYFRAIPGLTICSPMNEEELRNMMFTAQLPGAGPTVIRYPRGRGVMVDWQKPFREMICGKGRRIREGKDVVILSIGHIGNEAEKAAVMLEKENISAAHYDMRFLKPLDEALLHEVFRNFDKIITVEDGTITGGLGSAVLEFMADHQYSAQVTRLGIPDRFIEQGTVGELQRECGFDANGIIRSSKFKVQSSK
ncbi:MAG: 1-deoxy-D-xylulose-5-phosphate synthase [Bacteroidales bacterium]|nr:1-deoxy-D-xylulose-5-phosphate synthase [Bacteroidales bacterium]